MTMLPSESNRSTRWLPMKPAPPVTRMRFVDCFRLGGVLSDTDIDVVSITPVPSGNAFLPPRIRVVIGAAIVNKITDASTANTSDMNTVVTFIRPIPIPTPEPPPPSDPPEGVRGMRGSRRSAAMDERRPPRLRMLSMSRYCGTKGMRQEENAATENR